MKIFSRLRGHSTENMHTCVLTYSNRNSPNLKYLETEFLLPLIMCFCVSVSECQVCGGWPWKPKEVSGPLGLELQAIVNYSTWVLRTKLRSSGRVARSLNDPALSTAPSVKH